MRRARWISGRGFEIQFNHKGQPFYMTRLDGNDVSGEAETVKPPRSNGQETVYSTLGVREIHLEGSIVARGNYTKSAEYAMDELMERLAEAFTPHVAGTLIYETEKGGRIIQCRPSGLPVFGQRCGAARTIDIDFIADSPYWESEELHIVTIGRLEPRFSFPTKFDGIEFGWMASQAVIDIPRGEPIYPVIEVCTAGNGTTLINEKTNQKIRVDHPIGKGERMVIHTDPREMSIEILGQNRQRSDVTHWLSLDSLPFWLAQGRNIVRVSNDTADLIPVTHIKYRDRFMGVG